VICAAIKEAIHPTAGQTKWRLISCDEKTGIQALERFQERMSYDQGGYLRQEFEYTRHGTLSLIAGIDVATGQLLHHTLGPTRTEEDYLAFIEAQVLNLEPEEQVIFMMDQLNTHKSASLVRWVAGQIGFTEPLGTKGKNGILKSQKSRMAFLEKTDHQIRFLFTPKHCSWLNPIENWFGRLTRSRLKNLSVSSLNELAEKIESYIEYYNGCLAKAFNWKCDGFSLDRPLASRIS
jgi:transposase